MAFAFLHFGGAIYMYSVTIKNYLGKPIMQLAEVSPLVANYWYDTAIQNGYDCELEYVGGAI
jgi:hypothetical protein